MKNRFKIKKTYWRDFWGKQINGLHRSQDESYLETESKEKLFHLGSGEKLLDFGCGSADLLAYYFPHYKLCVGADRSKPLLEKASERLNIFNSQNNVVLLNSDTDHIWEELEKTFEQNFKFDCITTGQVIQYLNKNQIEDFIHNSALHLTDNGKICLFDIVDSRMNELWSAGLFKQNSFTISLMAKLLFYRFKGFLNHLRGKPAHTLGYAYPPSFFINLGEKYNLKTTCVNSMYYEYRYHIIYTRLL